MAVGTDATVSYYDLEALIRAVDNGDWDAIEKVLQNLRVDFETAHDT
jgi:hypothetical protein